MKYELKKKYLTNSEVKSVIMLALKSFNNKGLVEGFNYDYLSMDETFFDAIGLICIKDYNDKLKEEIFNQGLQYEILDSIKNAWNAYDKLYLVADKMSSIDNILNNLLSNLLNKMPKQEELEKISQNLPEEWQKILSQYNGIIGKNEGDSK